MLYPQSNIHRQFVDLSGFWRFSLDGDDFAEWIAVPASWNEQFTDSRDHTGTAWYQTSFELPWGWRGQQIFIRFNSVNYLAEVWLNDQRLGEHEGGHLPFAFDITDRVKESGNTLVVRVDGELAADRVPPGNVASEHGISGFMRSFPSANYDFFPYRGIDRPVLIYTVPQNAIDDVTVVTGIDDNDGVVTVTVARGDGNVRATLSGHGVELSGETSTESLTLRVPDAAFWSPESPNLYDLKVELLQDGTAVDSYTLRVGIRTFVVDGDRLLLNGEPVTLLGFGRHEDFPIIGKGLLPALIIKDYALMRWTGANSFRTTHYPYSEQQLDMADELGFLVIDETPAVGLFFRDDNIERRNELCEQYIHDMIARDKNHPSVVMWSIANEPMTAKGNPFELFANPPEEWPESFSLPAAVEAFEKQAQLVRELDNTRPVTLVSFLGIAEDSFNFMDVVCVNRYHGWYTLPGQLEGGAQMLSNELDMLHKRFGKPIIVTEFGADTIPGHHAIPPEMFSEEYQAEFLENYIRVMNSKPFVAGQHIWNLCDFKTGQGIMRVNGLNHKGIFTRDRKPKMAAHRVRQLWKGED
jgi:beta-glucuronidase